VSLLSGLAQAVNQLARLISLPRGKKSFGFGCGLFFILNKSFLQ